MENHHRRRRGHGELATFCCLAFSFLIPFRPSFAVYAPATKIFLNCGASDDARQDGRKFVADLSKADNFQFLGPTLNLTNPKEKSQATPSSVYVTARVSSSPYSYELTVRSTGTHFLRLHFSPFATTSTGKDYDLHNATFGVSTHDTYTLLTNFSPAGRSNPIVKEYLLWVSSDVGLNLTFIPAEDSIAFVNAIELFTSPDNFIPSSVTNFITQQGHQVFDDIPTNNALETVYHINAGGSPIARSSDELWRKWNTDKKHLFRTQLAQRVSTMEPMKYMNNSISAREFAPESVYNTAEMMNADGGRVKIFNVTWNFSVAADHKYLVRMHFCDLNFTFPDDLYFNVYLNHMMATEGLRPANYTNGTFFTPFFLDYIVTVGATRMIRVSVGSPRRRRNVNPNAILNGLEIMKLNKSDGSFDGLPSGRKPRTKGSDRTVVVAAAVAVAVVLFTVAISVLVVLIWKRNNGSLRRRRPSESSRVQERNIGAEWKSLPTSNGSSLITGIPASPRVHFCLHISLEELKLATKNFDDNLVVGSGGFGNVYYGQLRDGTPVAVKRGTSASKQGNPEFQNEISLLSQIRHRHLVSLIGFCDESNQMILVYEYMNKGTLRSHLYDRNDGNNGDDSSFLSWEQRLKICIGSARGLHYLHTGYSPGIIHRDVKSSNILLTAEEGEGADDCLAKVSDFGLSRVGPDAGKTHVSTAVKGSFGYLDPEYFKTQKLTEKSDVYSFGVVLFEVLCARAAIDPNVPRDKVNLAEWAVGKQRAGLLEEIVDRRLKDTVKPSSLRKFGETAEKCLVEDGWDRPSMGDVLWNLEQALQMQEIGVDGVSSDAQVSALSSGGRGCEA